MHRGTYSKIPVIMGDYTTDISKEKIRRSWYSDDDAGLYYVKTDGVTVIDVWRNIINKHEQEGNHERFWTDAPIRLTLKQKMQPDNEDSPINTLSNTLEIHGTHEGRCGSENGNKEAEYELVINKNLSLGLTESGVILNDLNDNKEEYVPKVVNPLLLQNGGTGNTFGYNKETGSFGNIKKDNFIVLDVTTDGKPYLTVSDYKSSSFDYSSTIDELKNKISDIEAELSNILNNKLPLYVSKSSFNDYKNKVSDFANSLPNSITEMLFPTGTFNNTEGVRILRLKVSGSTHEERKSLKIIINRNTGYGKSPAGDGTVTYRDRYNHDDLHIDLYGLNNNDASYGADSDKTEYKPKPDKFSI